MLTVTAVKVDVCNSLQIQNLLIGIAVKVNVFISLQTQSANVYCCESGCMYQPADSICQCILLWKWMYVSA